MEVKPIGIVSNGISPEGHSGYREMESVIILSETLPDAAFDDLHVFTHLEVVFYHHLAGEGLIKKDKSQAGSEGNGLRNSLFGTCIVKFLNKEGKKILVKGLDACNGSAVIDLKPVMDDFIPKEGAVQPGWARKME